MTETPRDQAASDRPDAGGADRAASARLDAAVQRSRRLSLGGDEGGDDLDALQKVYGEEPAAAPRRPVSARRPAAPAAPAGGASPERAPAADAPSASASASSASGAASARGVEPAGSEGGGRRPSTSAPAGSSGGAAGSAAEAAGPAPLADTQLLSDAAERARERMGLSAPRSAAQRAAAAPASAGAPADAEAAPAAPSERERAARDRAGAWGAPAAESAAAAAEGGDESPASADAVDEQPTSEPAVDESDGAADEAAADAPERRTVVVDRTTAAPDRRTGASSSRRAADEAVDRAFAPLGLSETKADSLPDLPSPRGNRVFGVIAAVLATALFGAAYAAAFAGLRVLFTSGAEFVESLRAFATTAPFWLPTAVFGVLFIVWALVGRRAGTWSYVFGGLLAAVAAFGTYHLGVVAQGAINGDGWSLGALQDSLTESTNLPGALTAAIVAREAFTWVGLVVAARGRRIARLDARDREAYDRAVADAQAGEEREPAPAGRGAADAG